MGRRGIEMSLAQVQAHQCKHGFEAGSAPGDAGRVNGADDKSKRAGEALRKPKSEGRRPNRTEAEYGLILRAQFPLAEIRYEAYTLRLADGLRYTPDWSVEHPDGRLEFFEVKGVFVFSRSMVKPKAAAELFPQRFTVAQKLKTGWEVTQLRGKADRIS